MTRLATGCAAIVVLIAACDGDDPTAPLGPTVRVIAGADLTDTISTAPTQALVARLLGGDGRPEAGVEVRFEVPPVDTLFARMQVARVGQAGYSSVASATTDHDGRAAVRVRLGTRTGLGLVLVSVPLYDVADTARYTVLPGAAVRVALSPKDTVLVPDAGFTYRGTTLDRLGNARQDPATYEVDGTAVSVDASGRVIARATGIATVRLRATVGETSAVDSGTVAVVPVARAAWTAPTTSTLMLSDLTGENVTTLVNSFGLAPSWAPSGDRLVYVRADGLALVDLAGNTSVIQTPGLRNATWPEFSADNQWIYFHAQQEFNTRIFRIRPDGSDLQFLGPDQGSAQMPTPSPDGRSVAWVTSARGELVIQELNTSAVRIVPGVLSAQAPRWSPDGAWIAFTIRTFGELMLVRPDGTDLHRVGEHGLYPGIYWSPDSKWIIGLESRTTLVDLTTGKMSYLPWRGQYPAWQP